MKSSEADWWSIAKMVDNESSAMLVLKWTTISPVLAVLMATATTALLITSAIKRPL